MGEREKWRDTVMSLEGKQNGHLQPIFNLKNNSKEAKTIGKLNKNVNKCTKFD